METMMQLTLFDIMGASSRVGETYYRVVLSEVHEYVIQDVFIESDRTLYVLKSKTMEHYEVVNEDELDMEYFVDRNEAHKEAELSLASVIHSRDMRVKEFEAYSYNRKCDGKKLTAFYAILRGGAILAKDPLTPQFIYNNISAEEAKKHLYEVIDGCKATKDTTLPPLKNMFRCKENNRYLFTEAICCLVDR